MDSAAMDSAAIDGREVWRPGEVWRDIARGGLAGLVVGLVVAGLGGRIAMRLAALRVGDAAGAFTENGNRIGDITLAGSLGLILVGLLFGAFAGTIWVVVRPWLPGAGLPRALVAMIVAIGLGSFELIRGENSDFTVLKHDPVVVGLLVGLVGLVGLSVSLVDGWLDRRLPVAASVTSRPTSIYVAISLVGALLILPLVVSAFLGSDMRFVGLGLVVVGLATLRWWVLRFRGCAPIEWAAPGRSREPVRRGRVRLHGRVARDRRRPRAGLHVIHEQVVDSRTLIGRSAHNRTDGPVRAVGG